MNEEVLNEAISDWEPPEAEVVRTIDTFTHQVERIVKVVNPHRADQETYSLYRYFTIGDCTCNVHVSVDLDGVDADEVIQHLAERL